jgi:hypothetical protein
LTQSGHRPIGNYDVPLPATVVCRGTARLLAYVYFEDEAGRRSAAKLLSKDEARRIAINIAKLPDSLLGLESPGRA